MYGKVDTRFAAFIWDDEEEMVEMVVESIATSLYYECKLREMGFDFDEEE